MLLCHLSSDVYSNFIYPFQIRFLIILRQPSPAKMNNSSELPICSRSTEPLAISWIKIVVHLLLLGSTLLGNTLVICTVYRNKRMHTAPNFLIVNMAVSCEHV